MHTDQHSQDNEEKLRASVTPCFPHLYQKNVRNPNHHYFSESIAVPFPFVLQYASHLYCSAFGALTLWGKGNTVSTPPICIAVLLPFVLQYASHLYRSTFGKILVVVVTGMFPIVATSRWPHISDATIETVKWNSWNWNGNSTWCPSLCQLGQLFVQPRSDPLSNSPPIPEHCRHLSISGSRRTRSRTQLQ